MGQPLPVTLRMGAYVAKQKLLGRKRFPMVLMLEPTLKCNLTCTGCGKIRQDEELMGLMLSYEECMASVEECGAPAVSIAGGEPLVHPEIDRIVAGCIARKKLTMLCTNGILIERAFKKMQPSPYFTFIFHLDGLREHHDLMVERHGVFDKVIAGIKRAKELGFRVATNTTLFKSSPVDDTAELFRYLMGLGVDGVIVSPAFSYEEVDPAHDIFMSRDEAIAHFRQIHEQAGPNIRYYHTPQYIDFLRGERFYMCTPWGNPLRDPGGWKGPCYLLTDQRYDTFEEMIDSTRWEEYGYGRNPRCAKCMAHVGYEASTVVHAGIVDSMRMMSQNLLS
ncbi:MAG: adenosyl-hopene transferase HpnH [Candidatus Sericytochromatia bacterium]|uniref:Adenosyl-hopene transferase HpnH n=1 Tax=Candidatus Tanganyikabacteria bacterium TaxID=2961651 RepID=A0A937X5N7_9BACT|nr:adenosyl-hopene transferase HpnH [Candidatus Tanganyikabacteria bacterium]